MNNNGWNNNGFNQNGRGQGYRARGNQRGRGRGGFATGANMTPIRKRDAYKGTFNNCPFCILLQSNGIKSNYFEDHYILRFSDN